MLYDDRNYFFLSLKNFTSKEIIGRLIKIHTANQGNVA